VLTGCLAAGTFDPFLGGTADAAGDQTTETALIGVVNVAESSSNPEGLAFIYDGHAGGLSAAANQVLRIYFEDGHVDAASGAIAGLTVYELLAVPAATGEYDRGPAIPYTATVVLDGQHSSAYLSMDLSGATVSTPIEIAMDGATLTANGGVRLFNSDYDNVAGETGEDSDFGYPTVSGAPVDAAVGGGDQRSPDVGISFTLPGAPTATDTTILITGINSGGYTAEFDTASLAGFTLWLFTPSTLTWAQETVTTAYAAGILTMTLADAVVANEIYQVRYDRYNITTNAAVYGFVQRDTLAQNDSASRYLRGNLLPEGNYGDLDSVTASPYTASPLYADVNFDGSGDIILSTVTADSVRFLYNDVSTSNGYVQIPYNFFVVLSGADGNNTLRFYFSSALEVASNDDLQVLVYPTVMDNGVDPADAADDFPILDVGESYNGISTETDGNFN
jgi:hypothetical protein